MHPDPGELGGAILVQLEETLELLRTALADDLAAAYLYGSATLGGLKPRSDIDVLAIARRATTRAERHLLGDALMRISAAPSASGPRRPIELTIVAASDVKPVRLPPRTEFQYGEWLRTDFQAGRFDPANPNDMDLVILLAEVRQHGQPLLGAPAAELVGAIDGSTLDQAMLATIPALIVPDKLASDTANVLLTLARIWTTLSTREIEPKDVAANWAIARLGSGERLALERARDTYLAGTYDAWDVPIDAAEVTAAALVAAIARAVPGATD